MNLEILTPDKKIFNGEVISINVPGEKGPFTVLHNHAPIISTLTRGKIRYTTEDKKTEIIDISGGIIEVKRNKIIVLADQ